jgi:hypothetical protein
MTEPTQVRIKTFAPKCQCPKCGNDKLVEVRREQVYTSKGPEEARRMKCPKDGAEILCHTSEEDEKPKKCECEICHKPPQDAWIIDTEHLPEGDKVTYRCPPCAEHPVDVEYWCVFPPKPEKCKCPKCGNDDPNQFEQVGKPVALNDGQFEYTFKCKKCKEKFKCVMQDNPKCECPKCHKFNATQVGPKQKILDAGGKEIWRTKWKCNDDGEEFECEESSAKECKCDKCGATDPRTEIGRTQSPDGTAIVKWHCDSPGCGNVYECVEGKGKEGECKCPKCGKSVADFPDEFEEESPPTQTADGNTVHHYKHKPDGTSFVCTDKPGKGKHCQCPKCKSTNPSDWEEIGRRKSENGDIVKFRCKKNNCGATFECQEKPGSPCKCPTCGDGKNLEEIQREGGGNGTIVHYRCKIKGHTKHLTKCGHSPPLPNCVADCVELKKGDPKCKCPKCGAEIGTGLDVLETETVDMPEIGKKVTVKHMKCKCGHKSDKKCITGKFDGVEATECYYIDDEAPKCPHCGSHKIKVVNTEVVEK